MHEAAFACSIPFCHTVVSVRVESTSKKIIYDLVHIHDLVFLAPLFQHCTLLFHTMASPAVPTLTPKAARFVTLQHAFHPEAAPETVIATPTAKPISEENAWGVAWAEATMVEDNTPSMSSNNNNIQEMADYGTTAGEGGPQASVGDATGTTTAGTTHPATLSPFPKVKVAVIEAPFRHGYLIDNAIGLFITVFAVGAAWLFEFHGLMVYLAAVLLDRVGRLCGIRPLFYLLVAILLSVDSFILACSVATTELLGIVAQFLTTLSAGCKQGAEWHQYIRKLCVLAHWVVRHFHRDWEPKRQFPCCVKPPNELATDSMNRHSDRSSSNNNTRTRQASAKESSSSGQPTPQLVIWE
jgi:hypothetical protein